MIRVTLRQLQYFDALAQTLHFGRAAQMAGVSQPALSAQIAEMEERLSSRLFERGGKTIRLTDTAEALRPRIESILAEVRDLETNASKGRKSMQGRFRLGIIPTVAPYLLPYALPALKERFPNLSLELREAVTATLVDDTASGLIDGFVAALPLDYPGLALETLFRDRFFLAVPANDPGFDKPPVPPESPALERLMLLEEGHCMRDQAMAICGSVKPTAMASYGATSLTTLLHMVSHGMGVTIVPEMAARSAKAIPGLNVVPFAEPIPSRDICLAWRRNGMRHHQCMELAEVLGGISGLHTETLDHAPG
ncbi:LysR family transcriptional regulator [Mesorhizobium sp. NBSH29]|uniref:hydrogen peroxide-inducible genes activator n=1 Tax=Mesorhizobium sp. NBSH29 TaxID=2654249 RepID=UPI0018963FB6|nr:hydrogen peroxide-inducible genes activator [Mesorhizobium sp. NBSH29]QPC86951.1 LysR family transcriptional regulator [Mesorhizobium sp. NBSH29]